MKIPLILIKSKTHIDSDLYDMRVNGDWHEFSKQDLKDLRSLIDTVLGEECAVCNPEWEGKQPIPLCEEHDEEILGQPLTEGECKKCRAQEEFHYEGGHKFEPQESNKEGEPLQKAFTRGNSCLYYQRRIRRSWWIETKRPR